jgi:cytoskeletal protein RodZ
MIGRRPPRIENEPDVRPRGFDDFDLRLGDVMRGERATMGKSLLDVQRELRIKASYIAAIENCDPSAFDKPGFIAGYVRSYARYLNMDPDRAFDAFCAESGFSPAHGMAADAARGNARPEVRRVPERPPTEARDPFAESRFALAAQQDSVLSRLEPGAIGSLLVLVALVGAIGYGGWSVLNEIQRVQLAPVDQTPVVLSDLDPLEAATSPTEQAADTGPRPSPDALDRLYRPQALDVPVLVARDAPISTLDPDTIGAFARADRPAAPEIASVEPGPDAGRSETAPMPQVVAEAPDTVTLFAIRPAWVRVSAADGSVIFEKILDAGEEYTLPRDAEASTLRAGMSGSVYFEVGGELYGPAGQGTQVVRSVALGADALRDNYQLADFSEDPELSRVIAQLEAEAAAESDE